MGIRFGRAALAATLALTGGCAGVPIQSGRSQVLELVKTRTDAATAHSVATRTAAFNGTGTQPPSDTALFVRDTLAGPLALNAAVQIALLRSPELTLQLARLGISAADVFDASRLANPGLSLAVLFPQGSAVGNRVSAGATLGFSDLLLQHARTRMAANEYRQTQQLVADAILNLSVTVQQAWFDCVATTQRATLRQTIDESAGTTAELAQRYQQAGNVNQLTVQIDAAAASEAHIAAQRARGELVDARARLQSLLGLGPSESHWTVPPTLPELPATETPVTALQSLAMAQRLDLVAARTHVSTLEEQLKVTHRFRYLGASVVGAAGEREADGTWRIGPSASLTIPLFNQGQGALARAAAELNAAQAAQRQLGLQISNDVQRQSDRLQIAREQALSYRDGLIPQRETVVARLQEQVNFMLTDTFTLLLAQQQEYAAYEGYIDAVHGYWSTRTELLRAVGTRLPDETPMEAPAKEFQP